MQYDSIKKLYNPSTVEDKWYNYWTKKGFFYSIPNSRTPYTIIMPPPNVTGSLHMGHMLNNTIQDTLVRRERMLGKNVCWIPGIDHASIATETKVVSTLATKGIYKSSLNREQFLKHAWNWTKLYKKLILKQLKKIGVSCDFHRMYFTMDKQRSNSVIKNFVSLYNKGLIYRDVRMINWDPIAKTAISDEEVYYKEQSEKLYYIRYQIVGEKKHVIVATTRPETIFGDAAVCINPNNANHTHLKGKKVLIPIVNREIPIIEDDYVSMEFGTGCLKVTPAHDPHDYILGEKYGLEVINILNEDGTLNKYGLQYEGEDRLVVRAKIEKHLNIIGQIEKIEPYIQKIGFSERTHVQIEPKLSMQWFLKMKNLAKPALDAVQNGIIQFHPAKFKNVYHYWMNNIKDWNISRQLWWGHQIPAFFMPNGDFVVAENQNKALILAKKKTNNPHIKLSDLKQDKDSLDTWFSSWILPISVFDGINKPNNREIKYYYPTSALVTAPDIIFFWVARMIMSGYVLMGKPCVQHVYFTGVVRDKSGKKMSKSLGNSPDPLSLINQYGADSVRFGLMLSTPAGNDLLFDETLCIQGRNFTNKIWNVFKLTTKWEIADINQPEHSFIAIKWFESQLNITIKKINSVFKQYKISEALMNIYKFFKEDFSAWYLEMIKPLYNQPIDIKTYRTTLKFFDSLLKLLHPFMPFITEEIWQLLENRTEGESIMITSFPVASSTNDEQKWMDEAKEIITNIRSIRLQKNIPNKEKLLLLTTKHELPIYYNPIIIKIANLLKIKKVKEKPSKSISFLVNTTEFFIPIKDYFRKENKQLNKLKKELHYYKNFLAITIKKLNNNNFTTNAPSHIVQAEQKKKIDTELKIKLLQKNLTLLT